jgi:hypothetical protein
MMVAADLWADEAQFLNKTENVRFEGIKVNGTAYLHNGIFDGPVTFRNATIGSLEADDAKFRNSTTTVDFYNIKVNGYASLSRVLFDGAANFASMDIGKDFDATQVQFSNSSESINFFSAKVGGNGDFREATFAGGLELIKAEIGGNLDFSETQATNTSLDKRFSGARVDTAIFDGTKLSFPYWLNGMTYRLISADSEEQLEALISDAAYSPDAYTTLEAYFRRMGVQDAADDTYVVSRNRERDEKFKKHPVAYLPKYVWNWIIYVAVGYGKHVARALLWSILVIVIGCFVFRREDFMETREQEEADRYKGRYRPVWYSIALHLPIVELEDAKVWTPRRERKKARFYMRLHIILGYLLVPIGLAAWTGLIK